MTELTLDSGPLLAILQIIVIDILLGGDNAIVIALACRKLPPKLRRKGIAWGVVGAVALRVLLVFSALQLLALPYLKIVGALLLIWIGVKLLRPADEGGDHQVTQSEHLFGAIRTIVVADAVMSIDNVVAVAAAAKGHIGLVAFGIAISVPIIVWGSKFVLWLMDRFPRRHRARRGDAGMDRGRHAPRATWSCSRTSRTGRAGLTTPPKRSAQCSYG